MFLNSGGSRHQTPDTVDELANDLPPRYYGYLRGRGSRRDTRRGDDRRRTTDDEETVLDSQDVSSADRGKYCIFFYSYKMLPKIIF